MENVLAYWCVLDVSLNVPSLAVMKSLSRPSVGAHGMGERFFRGDNLSVSVYDTFETLVDTNGHLFLHHLSMLASISNDYSYTICRVPSFGAS